MLFAPTNQQDLVSEATSGISGGTLISRNVWSNKDINMVISEEDLTSCKRENEDYIYSNKLKKTWCIWLLLYGYLLVASLHNHKILWYCTTNIKNLTNYQYFLDSIKPELLEKLNNSACILPIKFNLKLEFTYNKPHDENSSENRAFKTSVRKVFMITDIEHLVDKNYSTLLMEEDTYMGRGSGFSLQKNWWITISHSPLYTYVGLVVYMTYIWNLSQKSSHKFKK